MNGVAFAVHQSSSRVESRKLVSITRSPSVAVVSEIAPMWMMASSLRPSSQVDRSAGGTTSASCRLARLRHLPSDPRKSQTTTSDRPESLSAATIFEPIKPAPPVTKNIDKPQKIVSNRLLSSASIDSLYSRERGPRLQSVNQCSIHPVMDRAYSAEPSCPN